MKSRWPKAVLLVLAISLLTVLLTTWLQPREPVYQGQALSYWLEQLGRDGPQLDALRVLGQVGPDAIPVLMRAVEQNDSAMCRGYRTVFPKLPDSLQRRLPPPRPRDRLLGGIQGALGKLGSPAIPILNRLLHDPDPMVRLTSLATLAEMKSDRTQAIPALIEALKDDYRMRNIASQILGQIGPESRMAAGDLTKLLDDPKPEVQVSASIALWQINGDTNVLPVIARSLREASSPVAVLRTLGEMGSCARPSVEAVLEAIPIWERHPDASRLHIRQCAREALAKIDPEAVAKVEDSPSRTDFPGMQGWRPPWGLPLSH